MGTKIKQGQFEVIDSFAIKRRKEFYLIGQLLNGDIQEGWFINVPFNGTLALTVRISAIEEILFSSEQNKYVLIVINSDIETIDLLLGLKIGSEYIDISIDGED
jgi:hypothetical protein